jgi:hypothetical protein
LAGLVRCTLWSIAGGGGAAPASESEQARRAFDAGATPFGGSRGLPGWTLNDRLAEWLADQQGQEYAPRDRRLDGLMHGAAIKTDAGIGQAEERDDRVSRARQVEPLEPEFGDCAPVAATRAVRASSGVGSSRKARKVRVACSRPSRRGVYADAISPIASPEATESIRQSRSNT